MSTDLLNTIKDYFVESTTDFYNDMRHELGYDEYPDHYKELGQQLAEIEKIRSISDLIRKLDKEEIVSPLAIKGEDEILDETLDIIFTEFYSNIRVAL